MRAWLEPWLLLIVTVAAVAVVDVVTDLVHGPRDDHWTRRPAPPADLLEAPETFAAEAPERELETVGGPDARL